MEQALRAKTAIVTGASSGIGQATALALAEAGARLILIGQRRERLDELATRIVESGGQAQPIACDVSIEAEAKNAVEAAVSTYGRLDILVNAAGIIRAGGVDSLPAEGWRRSIDVNLFGTLYCCQAALAPLKRQRGDIVNISSLAARRVIGTVGAYAASKFAVAALTEGLRQEVGSLGVRVCAIEPGQTRTDLARGLRNPSDPAGAAAPPMREGAMSADDVATAVRFVVSLPPGVNISQLTIRPTNDPTPT